MIYVYGAPTYRFIDNEEEGGRRRRKGKKLRRFGYGTIKKTQYKATNLI